jgi:hypothetical protein
MNKIIILSGGYGRIVAASGSVIKYCQNNPSVVITVHGWVDALQGLIKNRIIPYHQSFLFEDYIKDRWILEPEPYKDYNYYNRKFHLTTCFNGELNGTYEFVKPSFSLSQIEDNSGYATIKQIKEKFKKVIIIQPFGSTAQLVERNNQLITLDNSNRSIPLGLLYSICASRPDCAFLNLSQFNQLGIGLQNFLNLTQPVNQKIIGAIVKSSDAVISIDSLVNHLAAVFEKPTIEIFGGSDPKNLGYSEYLSTHKLFIKENYPIEYSETRINIEPNREFNRGCFDLTKEELEKLLTMVGELV